MASFARQTTLTCEDVRRGLNCRYLLLKVTKTTAIVFGSIAVQCPLSTYANHPYHCRRLFVIEAFYSTGDLTCPLEYRTSVVLLTPNYFVLPRHEDSKALQQRSENPVPRAKFGRRTVSTCPRHPR